MAIGSVAAGVYDVRDFGAKGDGVAKDTAAIQAAIDKATAAFPFKNITFSNIGIDTEVEAVNVDGLVIDGGRLREKVLSPECWAKLSDDISNYRNMTY